MALSGTTRELVSYTEDPPAYDFTVGRGSDLVVNLEVYNPESNTPIEYSQHTASLGINTGDINADDEQLAADVYINIAGRVQNVDNSSCFEFHLPRTDTINLIDTLYPYTIVMETDTTPTRKSIILTGLIRVLPQQEAPAT